MIKQFALGATLETLTSLRALRVCEPSQLYSPYSKILEQEDGSERGTGWPVAEWFFSYLSDSEYNVFKTLCPGISNTVYVRTLDDLLAWHTYRAIMALPHEQPDVNNDFRMKMVVRFKILEVIS